MCPVHNLWNWTVMNSSWYYGRRIKASNLHLKNSKYGTLWLDFYLRHVKKTKWNLKRGDTKPDTWSINVPPAHKWRCYNLTEVFIQLEVYLILKYLIEIFWLSQAFWMTLLHKNLHKKLFSCDLWISPHHQKKITALLMSLKGTVNLVWMSSLTAKSMTEIKFYWTVSEGS